MRTRGWTRPRCSSRRRERGLSPNSHHTSFRFSHGLTPKTYPFGGIGYSRVFGSFSSFFSCSFVSISLARPCSPRAPINPRRIFTRAPPSGFDSPLCLPPFRCWDDRIPDLVLCIFLHRRREIKLSIRLLLWAALAGLRSFADLKTSCHSKREDKIDST